MRLKVIGDGSQHGYHVVCMESGEEIAGVKAVDVRIRPSAGHEVVITLSRVTVEVAGHWADRDGIRYLGTPVGDPVQEVSR